MKELGCTLRETISQIGRLYIAVVTGLYIATLFQMRNVSMHCLPITVCYRLLSCAFESLLRVFLSVAFGGVVAGCIVACSAYGIFVHLCSGSNTA